MAKDVLIKNLETQVLECKGVLNCRGLPEQMLKDIHITNQCKGKFNASDTIKTLGHGKKGGTEEYLIRAAESLCTHYKEAPLTIKSIKRCTTLCHKWYMSHHIIQVR